MKQLNKVNKVKLAIYLKESTYNLLIDYMNQNEEDNISGTIDNELANRFNYLIEAKKKAEAQAKKEEKKKQTTEEWFKNYWEEQVEKEIK